MKILIILALFSFSFSSFAFTLNSNTGKGFKKDSIRIRVASTDCSGAGFSTGKFAKMVKTAVKDYWNSVPSSALKLKVSGVNNSLDIDGLSHSTALNTVVNSNEIVAGCNDDATDFTDPDILGSALMSCSGSNCKAVLILNANNSTLNSMNTSEIEAVIAHEIGHAIGLGHSKFKHNLMYYNIGGKNQKWLGQDDINGVTYLYPHEEELSCLLGAMGGTINFIDSQEKTPQFLFMLFLGLLIGRILFYFLRYLTILNVKFFSIKLNKY